jgi:hypothetical protein
MEWKTAPSVVLVILMACGGQPNQSYVFPTAIIGVPVRSPAEGERIKTMLEEVAADERLVRYRPREQAGFAEMKGRSGFAPSERITMYNPSIPELRTGFSLQLEEYSPECFVISVSERSAAWTRSTLQQFERVRSELVRLTDGRSTVFVRPKPEQNWPTQQHFSDPERPTYLAELCVRMGFQDPRSPAEIAAQGPLSVQAPLPNKTMEPTL